MTTTHVLRWWTVLITILMAVRMVTAGLTLGLVFDVNTCICTAGTAKCTIMEISDQHYPWHSSEFFPEEPRHLEVKIKQGPNDTPTVNIKWLPPTGASFYHLNAFWLDISLPGSKFQFLYISIPDNLTKNTIWNLTCVGNGIIHGQKLSVVATSLPRPNDPNESLKCTSTLIDVPLPESKKASNAYSWKPDINFKQRGQNLIVQFPFPIQLEDIIKSFKIIFKLPIGTTSEKEIIPSGDKIATEFSIPDNLTCTRFTITITKYCNGCRPGKWFCKKPDGACRRPARITEKGSLNNLSTPTATILEQTLDDSVSEVHIASWIIPLVVVLAVITIIGSAISCSFFHSRNIKKYEVKLVGPKKLVYIIYSDVLHEHMNAVLKLAAYLEAECHCKVVIDEWEKREMNKDLVAWSLKYYEQADKIIFIHSEDTKSKYNEYIRLEKKPRLESTHTSKGDNFSRMLHKTMIDVNAQNDKYLMVQFPYTPTKCLDHVREYCCYSLPDHLDEFILHLHGFQRPKKKKINQNYIPGINSEEYLQADDGRALHEAIQKAAEVVRRNPNWLQDANKDRLARTMSDTDSHTQSDDNISMASDTHTVYGLLPPSSLDDIPRQVEILGYPPSASGPHTVIKQEVEPRMCNRLYTPTVSDDIQVSGSYMKSNIPESYINSSPMAAMTPAVPDSYQHQHIPNEDTLTQQYIWMETMDSPILIDSGFCSNEEATLERQKAMFQYPAGADDVLYQHQVGICDFYPPESIPSSCSSSVIEAF